MRDQNIALAERLIAGFRDRADDLTLAKLFSQSVSLEIQGDEDVVPWIGRKTGRAAAVAFFRNVRQTTEVVRCNVDETLGSEDRAVVVGDIALRLLVSGRVLKTQYVLILTVVCGEIVRFQVLGDSLNFARVVQG